MKQEIEQHITAVVNELFDIDFNVNLTRPDEQFGDYAINIALQLAKQLGKSPREVAAAIVAKAEHPALSEQPTIAGPGFINLKLTDTALWTLVNSEPVQSLANKTVVAEYSDPNPFKVLHAGHLYTSLVGDSISRLLEAAGANVKRVNFGGDVGLHVGKAMWAIIQAIGEEPEKLNDIPKETRAEWISQRYVEGSSAYESDDNAKEQIVACNKRVYLLHEQDDHDSAFAQVYWTCRQWSYDGFEVLYKKLGMVPFDKYYPESKTTKFGLETVQDGLAKGVFIKSGEAVVYEGDESKGLHTRVFLTSEGLPTYETKDLGLARCKWLDYKFDQNIIITGNDIIDYMKVVLDALSNFYPEVAQRTTHITHGMIKLAGGVKMSSRKGNVLLAKDVISAAHEAAGKTSENKDENVSVGAVRYAFLKQAIGGDIIYNPEESVSTHGNSGPYLQYAHARACSIISKSTSHSSQFEKDFNAGERTLVRKLGEYSEVIEMSVRELAPHHLCNYLYELAQEFNRFYEKNKVIGDPREVQRIAIVKRYADILQSGLGLLGIHAQKKCSVNN